MSEPLTFKEAMDALDRWAGAPIALRVVAGEGELLSVFRGRLGRRSAEKHPAQFWPLLPSAGAGPNVVEKAGVYLHPAAFEYAVMHIGEHVLELRQSGVTLNVRLTGQLSSDPSPRAGLLDLDGISFSSQPGPGDSDGG